MNSSVWRCIVCRVAHGDSGITPTLDPRWGTGPCWRCSQPRTFRLHDEPAEGEALKADGMALAAAHAGNGVDAGWWLQAVIVARRLAATGLPFTALDITTEVGMPIVRNSIGALLSGLARQGIIERVGDTKGSRDSQHARRISVWRGAMFDAA